MSLILSGTDGLSDVDGSAATPAIRGTDANTGIFFPAADTIAFAEGGAEVARFDSSGNFGLGVTPSAWSGSGLTALQIRGLGLMASSTQTWAFANAYFDGTNTRYINDGFSTYYRQNDSGTHKWYTAASGTAGNAITFTQAMTLTAAGDLGLGTTSPSQHFQISGTSEQFISSVSTNGANAGVRMNSSGNRDFGIFSDGSLRFYDFTASAERARIDSSGNLLVGTTSAVTGTPRVTIVAPSSVAGLVVQNQTATNDTLACWNTATSGNNSFVGFYTEGSITSRGSISYNRAGGLVAYNTMSDYRAKDIVGSVTDSGALIDSVPVYMGTMKGATQERPMFIAHETPAYAHMGEKDAVDADGNPVYQQMDASALIPVMWAEIQSLRKRLAALESA